MLARVAEWRVDSFDTQVLANTSNLMMPADRDYLAGLLPAMGLANLSPPPILLSLMVEVVNAYQLRLWGSRLLPSMRAAQDLAEDIVRLAKIDEHRRRDEEVWRRAEVRLAVPRAHTI